MSDYQLTTEDLERLTVQVFDSRYRTLAVVSALEDRFLSENAPWRALYAEHETTYSTDVPSAHHYRVHLVEELHPRLQAHLYTYTPSKLEVWRGKFFVHLSTIRSEWGYLLQRISGKY